MTSPDRPAAGRPSVVPVRRRVVVVTGDVLGASMAGPGIRAWQFATALADDHDVELVTSAECTLTDDGRFPVRRVRLRDLPALIARTDVFIVQGSVLTNFPAIASSDAVVVVDLYDPFHLEQLEAASGRPHSEQVALVHNATAVLNGSLRRGDFFLTASDKQRDFWLGSLAAMGRINPTSYGADKSLEALVAGVVPFGVDSTPPRHVRPTMRGVLPGVGPTSKVLLWGGGIYNWFDPLTLIRAVDVVRRTHDDVRLVFLGGKHPNPRMLAMQMAVAAHQLAADLGLAGSYVLFNEAWVPYEERGGYLLEADIGVSTHLDHVETQFSFRTRILDYLWAGLPIIATGGDVFGSIIDGAGLGATVPAGDVAALAGAIDGLLSNDAARSTAAAASAALAEDYRWERAVAPLLAFVGAARRAPDLRDAAVTANFARTLTPVRAPSPGGPGWRGELALARQYLDNGGAGLLARRIATRSAKLLRGKTS